MEPKLIAGDQQLLEFVREFWLSNDPLICIWQTESDPTFLGLDPNDKFVSVKLVHFYSKEDFHSLFFPHGFKKGVYNFVLAGIKEDNSNIVHVPMNGLLQGWLLGNDMEELTIDVDLGI